MDKEDKVRQMREEARNELESFIYASRDITLDSKYETFSTLEEREKLSKALSDASEWMEDHDTKATREQFIEKIKTLKVIADPIVLRSKEDSLRPLAVTQFEELMAKCKKLVETVDVGLEETGMLRTKFEQFSKQVEYYEQWFITMSKSQSELTSIQDPVLLSSDLKRFSSVLQDAHTGLERVQESKEFQAKQKKKEEQRSKSLAAKAAKETAGAQVKSEEEDAAAGAQVKSEEEDIDKDDDSSKVNNNSEQNQDASKADENSEKDDSHADL
jgi:hypoxia up-regulated 1